MDDPYRHVSSLCAQLIYGAIKASCADGRDARPTGLRQRPRLVPGVIKCESAKLTMYKMRKIDAKNVSFYTPPF